MDTKKIKSQTIMCNSYKNKWMCFEKTKNMCFLIKNKEFMKAYDKIWDGVNSLMNKVFFTDLVYNQNYLKTKIKSYDEFLKKVLSVLAYQ